MPYSLLKKQQEFAQAVPRLIDRAIALGFQITLGDAYRDKRCQYGAKHSKHHVRLAIDLNLFKDGVYLTDTEDHRKLGEWWEAAYGMAVWGGRFGDGNHYQWSKYYTKPKPK